MPDALILEKLGSAETFSIPSNAKPDGNATELKAIARKTLQELVWEVKLLVNNTATQTQTNSDAILQTTNVRNAKKMNHLQTANEIRLKLVPLVKLLLIVNGNVTEPIRITQNVANVIKARMILVVVIIQYVTTVLLHKIFKNVIIKLLNA